VDFEESLKPIWDDLVRYSRALAGSREEGDDLLQTAMLRAWKAFPGLKEQDRFKAWLISIIRHTHISSVRLSWVKRMVGLEAAATVPAPDSLPFEEKELVRLALRSLPLAQREALILFEILDLPIAQIAVVQKVTVSAVKSRLARGREKLEQCYRGLSEPTLHSVTSRPPILLGTAGKGGSENDR